MKTPFALHTLALCFACVFLNGLGANAQDASASDTQVYSLNDVDQKPLPKGVRAAPQYPFELKKAGISASAVIEYVVNEKGDTENVKATSASDKSWATACVDAVKQWKFKPAMKNGIAVKCRMEAPFGASLSKGGGKVITSKITLINPKKIDTRPTAASRVSIKYPDALQKAKTTGSVTVQYTITAKGTVEDIKITKTKHENFSKAVTAGLSSAKYKSAIQNGAPIDCRVQQTIEFDIDDE